jgi:hypothetical protein
MTTTTAPIVDDGSGVSLSERIAPSIPAIFFVVLALFIPFVSQHHLVNGDGDVARHIRHGLYMMQHRTLIWHDPFSYTRPGQPFTPFEYGSQLIYASAFRLGGLAGVAILAGCLIGATYALLARLLLRQGVDPSLVLVTTAGAVALGFPHWVARPHLISWVAIVVCFGLVEAPRRPPVWLYPLLFAAWANVHGGWLYGIALLGIYLVGHSLEFRYFGRCDEEAAWIRHLALAIPLACLGTLATPMGVTLWSHVYVHLGDSYVMDHTREFLSPDFHPTLAKILLVILLGALAALIASRHRMHAARFFLVFAGMWWSLTAARNIPLFGLTGLTVVALHIDPEWRRLPNAWLKRRRSAFAAGAVHASTTGWVLSCCAFLGLIGLGHGTLLGRRLVVDSFDSQVFPMSAVRAARAAHLGGRIFSDFDWGGYLLFAWPEQRVFIDGGTDFYGAAVMREYNQVRDLDAGWRGILDRRDVNSVLTRSHSRLAREIVRTPGWNLWYCDSVAVIVRRGSGGTLGDPAERERSVADCVGAQPGPGGRR